MRVPGGGASCLGMGRPGSGALPPPTARPLGLAARAHYPLAVGAGGASLGTHHQPHRARSCELALRAVGAARGRPGGVPLAWAWGLRGRALSHPRPLVLWGVLPGPTTHWLWVRGVRAWGPFTNPTAHAVASWLCALWRRHEGARGGRLLPGRGASGVGRSPTPDRSSFGACGQGPLPTDCGCGGWGRWNPSPTPPRALLRAGFARFGGGRRVPGGGASCLGMGRPGSGALPPPTARPLGRAAGPHYQLAVGAGDGGVGTRHQPHRARSCELALRPVGAARGRRWGAPLACVWGVRGQALFHPLLWVRCAGVGVRLSLAPSPVPRFVVCCARFPGLRHPVAVVAWQTSSCRGSGRRVASLACLVAPRWCAAPGPVRSLSVLRSAFPSPWCLPPPWGLSPTALLGGCAGHVAMSAQYG